MLSPGSHIVRWSPDGDSYAVVTNDKVDIYELESASVIVTIPNPKRISSLQFLNVGFFSIWTFCYRYQIDITARMIIYHVDGAWLPFSEFHPGHCWRWRHCEVTWLGWKEAGLWVQGSWNKVRLFLRDAINIVCHISPRCGNCFLGYRVKAVDSFFMEDYCVMVTASNDGFIKMWKLQLKEVRLTTCDLECSLGLKLAKKKKKNCFVWFFHQVIPNLI